MTHQQADIYLLLCYFNPHSRKGSDEVNEVYNKEYIISIHTPARGVTTCSNYAFDEEYISIHTPARGVTIVDGMN